MIAAGAPSLLCLNLRREHVHDIYEPEVARALKQLTGLLRTARVSGWRVMHAFTAHPRDPGGERGALAGFEPASHEPVFALTTASALAEPDIEQAAQSHLRIAGGVYSRCGLATAIAAQEIGVRVSVEQMASFAPSVHAVSARDVLNAAGDQRFRKWGNVICLEKRKS